MDIFTLLGQSSIIRMNLQAQSSFLLSQRITLLINRYEYFSYENNAQGEMVAFAEQDRFAFREKVTVWTSESKGDVLFTIEAEKILDIHGRFIIRDASGQVLGSCRKVFGASLLRSTWEVNDATDALVCTVQEKNLGMAVFRRIAQFVPVVSEISSFLPFNFHFLKDSEEVGTHARVWGSLNDRYALHLGTLLSGADRRLFLAIGILLDALQDR